MTLGKPVENRILDGVRNHRGLRESGRRIVLWRGENLESGGSSVMSCSFQEDLFCDGCEEKEPGGICCKGSESLRAVADVGEPRTAIPILPLPFLTSLAHSSPVLFQSRLQFCLF